MNFSIIMENHLADPEIGFYICVRLFQKEKNTNNSGDRTHTTWRGNLMA